MLIGKRFKLIRDTLALADVDGKHRSVTIPVGEIIKVASESEAGDGMIDVVWDGRVLEVFEVDVTIRGSEITEQTATA